MTQSRLSDPTPRGGHLALRSFRYWFISGLAAKRLESLRVQAESGEKSHQNSASSSAPSRLLQVQMEAFLQNTGKRSRNHVKFQKAFFSMTFEKVAFAWFLFLLILFFCCCLFVSCRKQPPPLVSFTATEIFFFTFCSKNWRCLLLTVRRGCGLCLHPLT